MYGICSAPKFMAPRLEPQILAELGAKIWGSETCYVRVMSPNTDPQGLNFSLGPV